MHMGGLFMDIAFKLWKIYTLWNTSHSSETHCAFRVVSNGFSIAKAPGYTYCSFGITFKCPMCHTFTTIAVCYEARKSSSCLSGVCVHECIFMKGSVQPYVFLYGWKQCDCAQPSIAFVSFLLFSNSLVCPPAFTVVSPVDYSNGSLHTHRVTQPKS